MLNKFFRNVLCAAVAMAAFSSCTDEAESEYPVSVITYISKISLVPGSTVPLHFSVGPRSAEVSMDMLSIASSDGSSELKPAGKYSIAKMEANGTEQGRYIAYIQDNGVSEEYSEKARLVINVNGSRLMSPEFEVECKKTSEGFDKFSLNGYRGDIDGNSIKVKLPYNTSITNMTASFDLHNAKAYVGGKEQESGVSRHDFSAPVEYKVVNESGDEITYTVTVCFSNLPTIFIKTPNNAAITSKEDWVENSTMYLTNSADKGWDTVYENMNIRGRGNSTWSWEKKPYAIKLDKKAEVMGMPKHKRWVLLANYIDRTCMRNAIAFRIARNTDLAWTPRGEFVDLVINGKFLGNYFLCEQIKLDENRVNIVEMESTDLDGDAITGGYLLELDTNFDEVNKFRSDHNLPVMIKEPDEDVLQPKQLDYIKDYFNKAEASLWKDNFAKDREYVKYIDVNSFIDWWFVHELTQNEEPKHPKSSYMHKDRNGKLVAGPIWDFDWETFTQITPAFRIKDKLWYPLLFQDPVFVETVKQRWNEQKPGFEEILEFIDETVPYIKESANANASLWPNITNGINKDHKMNFTEASARLRSVYAERIKWLDSAINAL